MMPELKPGGRKMDKERYRIDDAYEKVYEYNEDQNAYIFIGSFLSFGITKKMSTKKQIEKIEKR